MKILLINPPIPKVFRMVEFADAEAKKSIARRVMVGPPLALNELAGVIPDEEIIILDQKTENDNCDDYDYMAVVKKTVEEFQPDMVGVTSITAQYNCARTIVKWVKEYNSEILTMVGGIHATLCTDSFADSKADIISIGIGKHSIKEIAEVCKKYGVHGDYSKIPGIAINKGGILVRTKSLCELSYNEIKEHFLFDKVLPNRKLTDKYNYTMEPIGLSIHYLSTSSGCTHKCNFCSIWQTTDGRYFHKDVETIIDELKTMDRYNIIRFCDANTFGDIEKARRLFTRIIEEGLNKHFYMADIRTDTVLRHRDVIELAVKAGLKIAVCGLEATSNEELEKYNKQNTIENISEALKILNSYGVMVNGNYIVRHDYVHSDFERIARFVKENPIFHSGFTILTPFPGTELGEQMKDEIIINNYDYYNLTNAVVRTTLPEPEFYKQVGELYIISKASTGDFMRKYGDPTSVPLDKVLGKYAPKRMGR